MAGKEVISRDKMVQKVKAAVKGRDEEEPDMVIGARTDARSITGFDDVIERGIVYAKAGVTTCMLKLLKHQRKWNCL